MRQQSTKEARINQTEEEGFEPSVRLPAHRFSRPAQSAALAPLREASEMIIEAARAREKAAFGVRGSEKRLPLRRAEDDRFPGQQFPNGFRVGPAPLVRARLGTEQRPLA